MRFTTARTIPSKGSDASAAGGRESELSEWQRSTDAKAFYRRRQMSGTATGKAVTFRFAHCNRLMPMSVLPPLLSRPFGPPSPRERVLGAALNAHLQYNRTIPSGRVAPRCRWQMKRGISVCRGRQEASEERSFCRVPQTDRGSSDKDGTVHALAAGTAR